MPWQTTLRILPVSTLLGTAWRLGVYLCLHSSSAFLRSFSIFSKNCSAAVGLPLPAPCAMCPSSMQLKCFPLHLLITLCSLPYLELPVPPILPSIFPQSFLPCSFFLSRSFLAQWSPSMGTCDSRDLASQFFPRCFSLSSPQLLQPRIQPMGITSLEEDQVSADILLQIIKEIVKKEKKKKQAKCYRI